ncbi:MAG: hypothetical protein ACLPKE_31835 [Streptosporangiaceae bacterium]
MSAWGEHRGGRPHRHLVRRSRTPASRPEGQGFLLAAADAALVRTALADAAAYRESVMRACDRCWPYLPCDAHIHDAQAAADYRQFAALIGAQP